MIVISEYAYRPVLRISRGDSRLEVFNFTPLLNRDNDTINNVRIKSNWVDTSIIDYDRYSVTVRISGNARRRNPTLSVYTQSEQIIEIPILVLVADVSTAGIRPPKIPDESDIYIGIDAYNPFHEAIKLLGA